MTMRSYESLNEFLEHVLGGPVTKVNRADASHLSGVGSEQGLMTVHLKDGTVRSVFLKIFTQGSVPFTYNETARTMDKEILFYEKIKDQMLQFQVKQGIQDPTLKLDQFLVKYYGSGCVNGDLVLALEDMHKSGFKAVGRKEHHSEEQVIKSFETIAIFHATSYAMKILDGVQWQSQYPILQDYIHDLDLVDQFGQMHLDWNPHYLKLIRAIVEQKDHPIVAKHIQRFCQLDTVQRLQTLSPDVFKVLNRVRQPVEPHSVLCHGDFHMWNVAFSEDCQDLRMFDFQIMCVASGLTDLHFYLAQCTTVQTRKDYLSDFLKVYSTTFLATGQALGLPDKDLEPFRMDKIQNEYRRTSPFLYIFGLHYYTVRMVEDQVNFAKTKNLTDTKEIVEALDQCGPSIWKIFQNNLDLVLEVESLNTIKHLEEFLK